MIGIMRRRFGPYIVGTIVVFLILIFVFFGVDPLNQTSLLTSAGRVNGDAISISDFEREYRMQVEYYENLKIPKEQLKMFGLRQNVFERLVTQKLIEQAASEMGLEPSDEEVRKVIMEIPVFQKDGVFDRLAYREILQANRLTPGGYEERVRRELASGRLRDRVRAAASVSRAELRWDYWLQKDTRDVVYVLVKPEEVRKRVKVGADKVDEYLKDEAKRSLVESRFRAREQTDYKGKKLDDVKREIAEALILENDVDVVAKEVERVAELVKTALSNASASAVSSAEARVKALGLKLEKQNGLPRTRRYLPGVGEVEGLVASVFESKVGNEAQAMTFAAASGTVVVQVIGAQKVNRDEIAASELSSLARERQAEKEGMLFSEFLKAARDEADIESNPRVLEET